MDNLNEELKEYILSEFLPGEIPSNLTDDTPLRTSGILDSVAVLQLVSHIEQTYGIEVAAHETGVENFDSIAGVADLVRSKR